MAIEVPEAIRRLLNGDHELWKQHVLEAYNIGMCENAARHETGDKGMSETIQRYGVGVVGGDQETGRLIIDLVTAKRGIAVLYADHQREVAALEAENAALRVEVSCLHGWHGAAGRRFTK